jgi:hypothetical protein
LLVGGVFEGVGHLGCFAEGADAAAVPGAHEEGADYCAEDVAEGVLVRMFGQLRSVELDWGVGLRCRKGVGEGRTRIRRG